MGSHWSYIGVIAGLGLASQYTGVKVVIGLNRDAAEHSVDTAIRRFKINVAIPMCYRQVMAMAIT